ncbi:MAG: hypothetical protein ACM3ZF_13365 [Mycobacterium leprae]
MSGSPLAEAPIDQEVGGHLSVTVGELRELIAKLPDDLELCVGVRDWTHFNRFLGTLPVYAIRLQPCVCRAGRVVELEVPNIT